MSQSMERNFRCSVMFPRECLTATISSIAYSLLFGSFSHVSFRLVIPIDDTIERSYTVSIK